LNITFADFCVAFELFEPIFAATLRGYQTQEVELAKAVATLCKKRERAVTVQEVARHLGWKCSLVYKYVKNAVRHKLVVYEPGAKEKNLKRLLPTDNTRRNFLPPPQAVLNEHPEIGKQVAYIDPFTGEEKTLRRRTKKEEPES